MRVILIASGEKLQHGHCKRKSSSEEVELFSVGSNGFMLHTLLTMITLPYRNDTKILATLTNQLWALIDLMNMDRICLYLLNSRTATV